MDAANTVSNVGKKWTEEEEKNLLEELSRDLSIAEIAEIHKRKVGGINARREKIVYDLHVKGADNEEIKKITKLKDSEIMFSITVATSKEMRKKENDEKKEADKKLANTEINELKNRITNLENILDDIVKKINNNS
jgi:hypothetical protein